jgi:DUF35 OB-fold domain, acyl-CoA-associated
MKVLARLVVEAVTDASVDKNEISTLAFAQPRPYTQQKYFATFIANYLRLPCTGSAPAAFQDEVPYRVGIVDLDEGLRIATRVLAAIQPGLDTAVEIVVLSYSDGPLFAARPLA